MAGRKTDVYVKRWQELWNKCQTKGRTGSVINPGSRLGDWEKVVESRSPAEIDTALQIMEEIALNGNINSALQVFDSLKMSEPDKLKIRDDIVLTMPEIPKDAKDSETRTMASIGFKVRTNSKSNSERGYIKSEGTEWLTTPNKSDYNIRETKRRYATKGTKESQLETYKNKYEELWNKCQAKGREGEVVGPGSNLDRWMEFLNSRAGTRQMYEVEGIIQMMEAVALDGDIHKGLQIFDELSISDFDRMCSDVMTYIPTVPKDAADYKDRVHAIDEFGVRANSVAHIERNYVREENKDMIAIKDVAKSALRASVATNDVDKTPSVGRDETVISNTER